MVVVADEKLLIESGGKRCLLLMPSCTNDQNGWVKSEQNIPFLAHALLVEKSELEGILRQDGCRAITVVTYRAESISTPGTEWAVKDELIVIDGVPLEAPDQRFVASHTDGDPASTAEHKMGTKVIAQRAPLLES